MIKKYALVFIALLCSFFYGFGQEIASYSSVNSSGCSGTTYVDTNANASGICRGSGITQATGGTYNSNGWEIWASPQANDYLEWSITPNVGYEINLSSIDLRYDRSGTGPARLQLQINTGSGFNSIYTDNSVTDIGENVSINLSAYTNLNTIITFRIYAYSANASSGTFDIETHPTYGSNKGIIINGTVTSTCAPPTDPAGTISGTTPACANTTLSYSAPNANFYWQTTANGISTANPTTSTYNATSTGTYYVRAYDGVSCWSDNSVSYNVIIDSAVPNITTDPTNQAAVIPNTVTFSVVATGASSYQWEINTGSGWNNVSTGTGGTTNSYTTPLTTEAMNGYQYRCVVTNACNSVTSNVATLTLTNSSPNNVINIVGCFEDNRVVLNWDPPATGTTPTGYMVFALDGGTDPAGLKTDANTYTANTNFAAATTVTPASLGRVVYKGTATTTIITGLTEGNNYSFTTYAYVSETLTGWSPGATNGSTVTNGIAQGDVSNLNATTLTNQVNLAWNNPLPTSCFDELIIVANQGAVTFTPSGTYAPIDVNYSTPNSVVYATTGTVSSKAINGLTNNLNYCFKIYIRRGAVWTSGVEVCATPTLTYCNSDGGTNASGILNVKLNTIDNTSASTNSYSDYSAISTDLVLGETYNLSVNVNTGGNYTSNVKIWIDWNQDGSFNNSGSEAFELGTTTNSTDAQPSLSPLAINVPTNASIGNLRMRVSSKSDNGEPYATPCEDFSFGEVEDYIINVVQPSTAEINIKGNNIIIPNGFNSPYGLNNTLFGATDLIGPYIEKSYFISNLGLTTLSLTNNPIVEIIGANPGDFIVTQQPSANSIPVGGGDLEFRIEFRPTSTGTRNAQVRIYNNDSTGGENPYIYDIQGTGTCSTTITSSIWPAEGPENTEVTITSANDLTGAMAFINGVSMPMVSSSSTELVVSVPAGASSGNISVQFSTGCSSTNAFTLIDNVIGGCETATASTVPTDLFISEISDASSGSSSLIEIFNGTAGSIDLSDYSIRVFNNGSATPSTTANLTGTLAPGGVHVISIGTTSCDLTGNGLASGLPNQTFNSAGGINFDNNSSDMIQLYNSTTATPIDYFGVPGSNTWANSLGINGDGVNYRRQNTAMNLPDLTFDITDWDEIDWTTCGDSDYSDFGLYDFSLGVPPTVSVLSSPTFSCITNFQLSVTGTEGVPAGLGLTYQWYYLAPNASVFVAVPNNADFNNVTTSTLDIVNGLPYADYQFYCQVRENAATCYTASNAVKIEAQTAVWDGTWSSPPSSSKIVVINEDYDTNIAGPNNETSFEACQLIVSAGHLLTIHEGDYVEVINNVEVTGDGSGNDGIVILDKGSFVQRGDGSVAGMFTLNTNGVSKVNKKTAPLNNYYEYTYWSSPVLGESIGTGLEEGLPTRRYKYQAENYLDATMEVGNNNATNPGQDDIDDNGDDWVFTPAGETMEPGLGYTAMHNPIGFNIVGGQYQYEFEGPFNTGDINVTIYRNDSELNDNNWNFIGNPYPSAIDADLFLSANSVIAQDVEEFPSGSGVTDGAIFLWSQSTAPSETANGNQNLNFAQNDYAIINGTGETAGGDNNNDGVINNADKPNRFIPSGQGFFISYSNTGTVGTTNGSIRLGTVSFTNSMRVTGNNDQFFRTNNTNEANKLWINMSSNNGVQNQILIGYVEGATNELDGMYYDAPKNLSTGVHAMIYTTADNSDKKLAIQGKDPNSLTLDEIIPLGFYTAIQDATLYTISIDYIGAFFDENSVYLIDNELNSIHDLTTSNYTFTSETGEFNNRFEIVFITNSLSVDDYLIENTGLTIIEKHNDQVQFTFNSSNLTIKDIQIIDLLGRTVYTFKGSSNTETFSLSNLSSSAYMARVTLSNNQVIVKKAIKK